MPESVKKKACRALVPLCVKVCHSAQTTTSQPLKDDDLLSRCLSCLHRVYSLPQAQGYVPPVHHSAVIALINNLWSVCSEGKEHVKRLGIKTWCELMDLSSTLLPQIQPENYAKIISGVRSLLDKWPSLELREAAAQFLGKCGNKDIPEHLESAVLSDITTLFSLLVSDRHWLVHQRAFQSVKAFAEVTRYTHVMGDCVPERLLPSLSDFLNQLPFKHTEFTGNMTELDKEFLKQQLEAEVARKSKRPDPNDLEEKEIPRMDTSGRSRDVTTGETEEPEPKRLKRHQNSLSESQGEELYTEAITNMRIPLSTILDLRKEFVPSAKIVKQVEEIQTLLQEFVSKSTGR